jgi:hypothetical protein
VIRCARSLANNAGPTQSETGRTSPTVPNHHLGHRLGTAIAHLRDALGDQTYESLVRRGEAMTTAEMATYAYDQIHQARTELNAAGPGRRRTKTAVTAPVAAARTQPARRRTPTGRPVGAIDHRNQRHWMRLSPNINHHAYNYS